MTPCDDCGLHHFGLTCSGRYDDPAPLCLRCEEPTCEDDLACAECRAEARQVSRDVVGPALDELMWRRRLNAEVRTVPARPLVHGPQGSILGDVYAAVSSPGALAALGLALGSLAPLAAMLGGA